MVNNFSRVFSAELEGTEARLVEVEVDLHVGVHAFNIVGLGDKAVSEAKERVSSALKNVGVKPPTKENRKIVVNLAPADLKKAGSQYDLAIAIGYLLATKQIKNFNSEKKLLVGELALDGSLRPINGALNFTELARKLNYEEIILPVENADEASLIGNIKITPARDLKEVIRLLEKPFEEPAQYIAVTTAIDKNLVDEQTNNQINLDDIRGQENAKRALMIAAAGGHNILMSGTPGGGKTMLAQAIVSILPELSNNELIEVTKIYSAAGKLIRQVPPKRPFRAPHHNASLVALVGGGSNPRPGEITLAHRGLLFLDELPEFRRDALEALRQPLESGTVTVARAKDSLIFPARFMLVAAMNPCPCGYYNDDQKECVCSANEILRYQKKVSGPLLDRIDIQINVPRVEISELRNKKINSQENKNFGVKEIILKARSIQFNRQQKLNSELTSKECEKFVKLDEAAEDLLEKMLKKSLITARGYYKIMKIARTIADLEPSPIVKADHLQEAFNYRLRNK